MLKPPNTVRLVMEAVCVLCKVPPIPMPSAQNPKIKVPDYWEASKKFLGEKDFLLRLKNYDKDNIEAAVMTKVR
jgi:dynein heavy chain, axonemal